MLQRTKYIKSDEYLKYKPNLSASFQSSKYHHKKKSGVTKKSSNPWKKKNSKNWNKENDQNYLVNIHFDTGINIKSDIYKIYLYDESLIKYLARIIGG